MNKIILILKREYLTRVKKKSFIIMTFLGPLLMAALMIVPIVLATMQNIGEKNIAVLDETNWFIGKFEQDDNMQFHYVFDAVDSLKKQVLQEKYDLLVYIPRPELNIPVNAEIYSDRQIPLNVSSYIKNTMRKEVETKKLLASGIDPDVIKSAKATINLVTIRLDEDGGETKSFTEINVALGLFGSILIYFFIFIFGSQVMRGIIEEKTSRIVEVIISSVKPFELMMGKITGIALVGLTQFLLWVVLTGSIYGVFMLIYGVAEAPQVLTTESAMTSPAESMLPEMNNEALTEIIEVVDAINFPVIIGSFIFYFLGGYLLYAALFAAIGSAVDNEADTQQFMLPVSIPLILGLVVSNFIVNNPEGSLAFWLSIIPFTSPVVMMVRIPFGVAYGELALSMALLVCGFLFTTWIAAKIYRTGILMYGKKPGYKELWKWLRY
ncbi:MAG: ABC transporter permease [Bacteroidales bacterium]|nr:ABC transporter permease [Bacteroidales bacterium]MDY0084858.1 ABC transporter permease [Bacteroidales bacterium]